MSNLVNLVKALFGLMFFVRSFEAKNRVFGLDHQWMNMLEFVRCSKNDVQVRSMFDKMGFKTLLLFLLLLMSYGLNLSLDFLQFFNINFFCSDITCQAPLPALLILIEYE